MSPEKQVTWPFYVITFLSILAFFGLAYFYIPSIPFADARIECLTQLQEKQFTTFIEMNHLLITLATLTIGGMGAFVFNRYKTGQLPWYQIKIALASWICAGLSLCSGYLIYEELIWMFQKKFFNLSNPHILWLSRSQFWTFLVSIFFFAEFIFRGLRREDENVLVQREMESCRFLLDRFRPSGGDFQGMRVYRSDEVWRKS
jgi:hypothetical protein